jgi:hypothetical protein
VKVTDTGTGLNIARAVTVNDLLAINIPADTRKVIAESETEKIVIPDGRAENVQLMPPVTDDDAFW